MCPSEIVVRKVEPSEEGEVAYQRRYRTNQESRSSAMTLYRFTEAAPHVTPRHWQKWRVSLFHDSNASRGSPAMESLKERRASSSFVFTKDEQLKLKIRGLIAL